MLIFILTCQYSIISSHCCEVITVSTDYSTIHTYVVLTHPILRIHICSTFKQNRYRFCVTFPGGIMKRCPLRLYNITTSLQCLYKHIIFTGHYSSKNINHIPNIMDILCSCLEVLIVSMHILCTFQTKILSSDTYPHT